jgi:hypothetical protein
MTESEQWGTALVTGRSLFTWPLAALIVLGCSEPVPDLSGDWQIASSLGEIAIGVRCTLLQAGTQLSGSCTPELENPETSELTGIVAADAAEWRYDVFFNGSPCQVGFSAERISPLAMSGTLSLSGTPTRFTATRIPPTIQD